jgi:hypothetical protein
LYESHASYWVCQKSLSKQKHANFKTKVETSTHKFCIAQLQAEEAVKSQGCGRAGIFRHAPCVQTQHSARLLASAYACVQAKVVGVCPATLHADIGPFC